MDVSRRRFLQTGSTLFAGGLAGQAAKAASSERVRVGVMGAGGRAARVGRKLTLDPDTESFVSDPEANSLRTRPEYRVPWSLPEVQMTHAINQ